LAVAPLGSVLPSLVDLVAVADLVAVDDLAMVVEGAGLAGVAEVAGVGAVAVVVSVTAVGVLALVVFCMPPWPLQVPLPVDVLVVPSLQVVVGVGSAAKLGTASANIRKGAAMRPAIVEFFMKNSRLNCPV
jgi:hypothetical protein